MIRLHIQNKQSYFNKLLFLTDQHFTVHWVSCRGKDISILVRVHIHSKITMAAGETSELEIVQEFTLYHNAKK